MSSFATTTSVSAPSSLAPLVRTQHVEHDPETDDVNDTPLETYIILQSGNIYVISTPSSLFKSFTMVPFLNVGISGELRYHHSLPKINMIRERAILSGGKKPP
jgi:hypothetical protein